MMNATETLEKLRQAKTAANRLVEITQELETTHASLLKELGTVGGAFLSMDEVIVNMKSLVRTASDKWVKAHAWSVAESCSGHTRVKRKFGGLTTDVPVRPHLPAIRSGDGTGRLELADLCGLVPDLVESRLEHIIRGSSLSFGLPADERAKKLAEIRTQIADIEAQHTEMVDAAADGGVELQLLPSVRSRRKAEAHLREEEEERARGIFRVTI